LILLVAFRALSQGFAIAERLDALKAHLDGEIDRIDALHQSLFGGDGSGSDGGSSNLR
jgi:hypothetical protein